MNYLPPTFDAAGCKAQVSSFATENGIEERHIMLHATQAGNFEEQLKAIHEAREHILAGYASKSSTAPTVIFQRYFLSDAANQSEILEKTLANVAHPPTAIIQQPPLDGSKVALWLYVHTGADYPEGEIQHNGYKHLWTAHKYKDTGSVYEQSRKILEDYTTFLTANQCTLKENCIRTWFFVQDVDTNYADFVTARKEYFDKNNLTSKTHYITSTGIEGRNASVHSLVTMDAYAIEGIEKEQVKHLYALSHLSPTNVYGVTFERGTAVQFGDRQHIYISGTASIDSQGEVVHVGNVEAQTYRMLENIETLLKEADASMNDIAQAIVYLRDTADYQLIKKILEERFPNMPMVITLAPVCRPTWLIEMECIAVNDKGDKRFRDF